MPSTGNMVICSVDRGSQGLLSTRGQNFHYLINNYQFKKVVALEKLMKKDQELQDKAKQVDNKAELAEKEWLATTEVLCKLNEKVTKKGNLHEISMSWKSLASLASQLKTARTTLVRLQEVR